MQPLTTHMILRILAIFFCLSFCIDLNAGNQDLILWNHQSPYNDYQSTTTLAFPANEMDWRKLHARDFHNGMGNLDVISAHGNMPYNVAKKVGQNVIPGGNQSIFMLSCSGQGATHMPNVEQANILFGRDAIGLRPDKPNHTIWAGIDERTKKSYIFVTDSNRNLVSVDDAFVKRSPTGVLDRWSPFEDPNVDPDLFRNRYPDGFVPKRTGKTSVEIPQTSPHPHWRGCRSGRCDPSRMGRGVPKVGSAGLAGTLFDAFALAVVGDEDQTLKQRHRGLEAFRSGNRADLPPGAAGNPCWDFDSPAHVRGYANKVMGQQFFDKNIDHLSESERRDSMRGSALVVPLRLWTGSVKPY